MNIPLGREIYACDAPPVVARGTQYASDDLIAAWKRVQPILDDVPGKTQVASLLAGLAQTDFEAAKVSQILSVGRPVDVSLFGLLIRDVIPKREDLAGRTAALSEQCPAKTSIELRALYLPSGWSEPPPSRPAVKLTGRRRAKP